MKIVHENNNYVLVDQVDWKEEQSGELKEVFRDGKLLKDQSLSEIRQQIQR